MYLGRHRLGDRVRIGVATESVPDVAPIAVIMDRDDYPVAALPLPKTDATLLSFGRDVFVGAEFGLGSYSVSYQLSIGGEPSVVTGDSFDVIPGGDGGGEVISLYSFDRPEARLVVSQLAGGRLSVGRNPSI